MRTPPEQQVFAIYSRKSKFTGKGESIENQIEMCRQYISRCFGPEQADNALVYEDDGIILGTSQEVLAPQGFPDLVLIFIWLEITGP